MNLQERIMTIVSWSNRIPISKICLTTSFKEDIQLDEIDFISLILLIEKWFSITLTRDEIDNIETIKDLADSVSGKLKKYAA